MDASLPDAAAVDAGASAFDAALVDTGAPDGGPPDCGESCVDGEACELSMGVPTCVDAPCTTSAECPLTRFCDGERCRPDVCEAGGRSCDGLRVLECEADGGGVEEVVTCASDCVELSGTQAGCPCDDDWDCPAFMQCEAGVCEGTGLAPTCTLPTVDFERALPSPEIVWGGTFADPGAIGSPFARSSQVVVTPLVVNLDDDNGDGVVDELDFPEIVFVSYCESEIGRGGVLRAIHGGGPDAGADFFASCGASVWNEGMALDAVSCGCDGRIDPSAQLAAGDLDGDGVPEIVAIDENGGLLIHDARGNIISSIATGDLGGVGNPLSVYSAPAPALVNLDRSGLPEIVVGRNVFTLALEGDALSFAARFEGTGTHGRSRPGSAGLGSIACPADLTAEPGLEIVAGSTLYRMPSSPPGLTRRSECTGDETDPDQVAWCSGRLVTVWDGQSVNGASSVPDGQREGFCAIADVLGADTAAAPSPDNPLDEVPEVVLVANGRLDIYRAADGVLVRSLALGGTDGGAPNVDDFDGDGFPEVGTAIDSAFIVIDLQDPTAACPAWPTRLQDGVANPNPVRSGAGGACTSDSDCTDGESVCNERVGACVCLHNGWRRRTEDGGEIHTTGSSVFDFNGDGAVEVVYNDECWFRVYDGLSGDVYVREPSESRTRTEYPAIADVDNDGNVEIAFATTTESSKCSERGSIVDGVALRTRYNAGIEVWGDANDYWMTGRRVWNQNAYHVTNVHEDGSLPSDPVDHWLAGSGRRYNLYRSNPRTANIAPNLTIVAVRVSSPDAACGTLTSRLDIAIVVRNDGDVRVGPGVRVGIEGLWTEPDVTEALQGPSGPLELILGEPLPPGGSRTLVVSYDASDGVVRPDEVPAQIRVTADVADVARECSEDDNVATVEVVGAAALPDLRVSLEDVVDPECASTAMVSLTVANEGSARSAPTRVVLSAGDPTAGGVVLAELSIGALAPTDSETQDVSYAPPSSAFRLVATVDPARTIEECDESDNVDTHGSLIGCQLF